MELTLAPGESLGLVGPNGSGKSTLLKAIAGLVPLLGGEITLFDEPIARMRRHVAYVPQREDVDWSFPVTVRDVVKMGRYPRRGWIRPSSREDDDRAAAAMQRLGIGNLADRPVGELSGGQQRRAFIARAVAQAYLEYLYSAEGQEISARHYYRPRLAAVAAKYAQQFPDLDLATIDQLGGWQQAQRTHFADGGIFDQIYQPGR